jgi:hypothetical protein
MRPRGTLQGAANIWPGNAQIPRVCFNLKIVSTAMHQEYLSSVTAIPRFFKYFTSQNMFIFHFPRAAGVEYHFDDKNFNFCSRSKKAFLCVPSISENSLYHNRLRAAPDGCKS